MYIYNVCVCADICACLSLGFLIPCQQIMDIYSAKFDTISTHSTHTSYRGFLRFWVRILLTIYFLIIPNIYWSILISPTIVSCILTDLLYKILFFVSACIQVHVIFLSTISFNLWIKEKHI